LVTSRTTATSRALMPAAEKLSSSTMAAAMASGAMVVAGAV
jgi:hypothetical protein